MSRVDELETMDSAPALRTCPACGGLSEELLCAQDGTATLVIATGARDDTYIGRVIADRYRIDGVLGEGGMGRVYSAVQLSLGQRVAIKVLLPEREKSDHSVRRFHREALAATRLNSPNVVRVYDFGVDPQTGAPYLVMEYLRGKTVHSLLRTQGALSVSRALRILQQVVRALAEAEDESLVHRDIKPENLFIVDTADQTDFVKVMDFGVARSISDPRENGAALTQRGRIVGTPAYMSPEQVRGGEVTCRSDLYSAGCMLHEFLTASRPYSDSNDAVTTMVAHLSKPPPVLPERGPDGQAFPGALRCLHDALLQKEPEHRPPTARVVLQAIQAVLDGRPESEVRLMLAISHADTTIRDAPPEALYQRPSEALALSPEPVAAAPSRRAAWVWVALGVYVVGGLVTWWAPWDRRPVAENATPAPAAAAPAPERAPVPVTPIAATAPIQATEARRELEEGLRFADRLAPALLEVSSVEVPVTPSGGDRAVKRRRGQGPGKPGQPVTPAPTPSPAPEPPTEPKPLPW